MMSLFDEALDLESTNVPAFLDRSCPDDPELRREVLALIEADHEAGSFMMVPVGTLPWGSGTGTFDAPACREGFVGTPDLRDRAGRIHHAGPASVTSGSLRDPR